MYEAHALRSRRLLTRTVWPLLGATLLAAGGCMAELEGAAPGGAGTLDTSDTDQVSAADPVRAALRDGAYATPDRVGGFSVDGVGVYLSAVDDAVELMVYVVAPAERATFVRPAIYVTTQEGDHLRTETAEFEDVTLRAGESHVFRRDAGGPLVEAFADFGDDL